MDYGLLCSNGVALVGIWFVDNNVMVLNKHLSVHIGRYAPIKVICVDDKDMLWCDEHCNTAGKPLSNMRITSCEPMMP